MLAVVGARLRRLVCIIEELSFSTVRQRLVAALVRLAQTERTPTERGIEFQLPGTHQDLAHQLGTVRELVSRNLMRLQAEGPAAGGCAQYRGARHARTDGDPRKQSLA